MKEFFEKNKSLITGFVALIAVGIVLIIAGQIGTSNANVNVVNDSIVTTVDSIATDSLVIDTIQ